MAEVMTTMIMTTTGRYVDRRRAERRGTALRCRVRRECQGKIIRRAAREEDGPCRHAGEPTSVAACGHCTFLLSLVQCRGRGDIFVLCVAAQEVDVVSAPSTQIRVEEPFEPAKSMRVVTMLYNRKIYLLYTSSLFTACHFCHTVTHFTTFGLPIQILFIGEEGLVRPPAAPPAAWILMSVVTVQTSHS